jgi:SIR2-like domain
MVVFIFFTRECGRLMMSRDQIARLNNLLRMYQNNQCVLFVGAGYSATATRRDHLGVSQLMPSGRDLATIMKEALQDDESDLGALSDLYEDKFGQHGLFSLLTGLFTATAVTEEQKQIASFKWKEIYTTNYDNVLEECCISNGIHFSTYTTSKRPSEVDRRNLPIIHINGFVPGSTFADFKKEIRLTNTQYYSDDFSRSPWGERFRNDIITSPCVIFAGYSLYDLDVARVLNSFEGMRERIFFVLNDTISKASEKKLSAFGNITHIGTTGLSKIISEIGANPTDPATIYLSAWEKVELPTSSKALRDIDVSNFVMSGNFDEATFARDVIEKQFKLSINRTASDQIVKLIDDRRLKNAIVTGHIGNGKTTVLDSIAYKSGARNILTFRATRNSSLLLKEVPLLRQMPGPLLLLIDDAFGTLDVLKAIIAMGRDDLFVVTTARTSQFELQVNEIQSVFANNLEEFSLDALDDQEVSDVIAYMDNYAFWGNRQSSSLDKKSKFVAIDCHREIRTVILEVLDSPNIRTRIEEIINFQNDFNNRGAYTLIVSQLLNLAQIKADMSLISETLGFDARKAISQHENEIRDFALIQNGRISMRSPIFSEYILKKLIDTASVIDALTECMSNLDIIFDNDDLYQTVFKNFSRFSFVETAIAVEKRRVHMVKYFENIKELPHCQENSLFWLQYAMCRLSLH